MTTSQVKLDMENLRYIQACMLENKGNYYTELSNTTTTFNKNNNTPLSNVNIQATILKVLIEDE